MWMNLKLKLTSSQIQQNRLFALLEITQGLVPLPLVKERCTKVAEDWRCNNSGCQKGFPRLLNPIKLSRHATTTIHRLTNPLIIRGANSHFLIEDATGFSFDDVNQHTHSHTHTHTRDQLAGYMRRPSGFNFSLLTATQLELGSDKSLGRSRVYSCLVLCNS